MNYITFILAVWSKMLFTVGLLNMYVDWILLDMAIRLVSEKCWFVYSLSWQKSWHYVAYCSEGNPLFDSNHAISLALEGRIVPRRKPGRPRKLKPSDNVEDTIDVKPNEEVVEDIVDPEQALELMFKEAEEKRQSTADVSLTRRRRRIPQRLENSS